MLDSLLYVAAVFVALFFIYVIGRLLSAAYFRSKLEYMRAMLTDSKGGKKDGL